MLNLRTNMQTLTLLPLHRYQDKETFCVIVSGEVMRRVSERQVHLTRHTTSALYRWIGNHFDSWELLPGTNPVAAHHFMVNEFHYLAFANFQNNKGEIVAI